MSQVASRSILMLALIATFGAATVQPATGAVGLAEWEMKTPGGHRISHVDPLKARFGTCLRSADANPADPADVHVDHLEWWVFYRDHVVGKARSGYFIFNEPRGHVDYYPTAEGLSAQLTARNLGAPISVRLTPEDGWRQEWIPHYRDACDRLKAAGAPPAGVDAATYRRMQDLCSNLGSE